MRGGISRGTSAPAAGGAKTAGRPTGRRRVIAVHQERRAAIGRPAQGGNQEQEQAGGGGGGGRHDAEERIRADSDTVIQVTLS